MEPEAQTPRKGKRKLYRIGKKKTFFDKKSKRLKMSYRDISIFMTILVFILIGLFINIILEFIDSLR